MTMRQLFSFTATLILAAASQAQTTVNLRPRFHAGEETRYTLTQDADSRTVSGQRPAAPQAPGPNRPARKPGSAPGAQSPNNPSAKSDQSMHQEITLLLRTRSADPEGGAVLELVYESVKLKLTAGETQIDFDSTKPAASDDPIAAALGAVAGTTLTIHTDAAGAITKVEGGDSLGLGALLGQLAGASGTPRGPKDAFGLIAPSSSAPTRVKVGDSWTHHDTLTASLLGNVAMTTRHTLKSIRGSLAHVDISGSMEPASNDPAGTPSPFKVTSATTAGSYQWDAAAGRLESMDLHQSTRIELDTGGEIRTMESTSTTALRRAGRAGDPPKPNTPGTPPR